ncbi:putative ubiquitin-conjugating enzyme E2, ubiquitin-conjugating enzyme/RWD [Helianthus annuus]|nr:putative ubiquitin-conjugating enzyme E2, ubiquitin-conjugating enzyme/RWD [Helianthus annuus]
MRNMFQISPLYVMFKCCHLLLCSIYNPFFFVITLNLFFLYIMRDMFQISPLYDEWICNDSKLLEENLPETIFVRVYESRIDLLTTVIIGPKGTPYHDGLFFFDVFSPRLYPFRPPDVRYRSTGGFGIKPHMLECDEVCLNLTGSRLVIWKPISTTMLQLLLNVQDLVFNAEPLYNQPEFLDPSIPMLYNENIWIKSLKTMMNIMNKPPKVLWMVNGAQNFEAFVVGHFHNRVLDVLEACKAYIKCGLQVGPEEGLCALEFQDEVASCIKYLVDVFIKIGATEAYNFSHLTAVSVIDSVDDKDEASTESELPAAKSALPAEETTVIVSVDDKDEASTESALPAAESKILGEM